MAGSIVMEGQAVIPEYEVLLRSVMYSMSRFTCPLSRQLQVTVYSGNRCVTCAVFINWNYICRWCRVMASNLIIWRVISYLTGVALICILIFVLSSSYSANVQLILSTVSNHAPNVKLTHTMASFSEEGAPVVLFPSITITDDDDTCDQDMLRSATVHLNSNSADFNSEEVGRNIVTHPLITYYHSWLLVMYILACDCYPAITIFSQLDLVGDIDVTERCSAVIPEGTVSVFRCQNYSTGVKSLLLFGVIPVSVYEAILQNVTYWNGDDEPDLIPRQIQVMWSDINIENCIASVPVAKLALCVASGNRVMWFQSPHFCRDNVPFYRHFKRACRFLARSHSTCYVASVVWGRCYSVVPCASPYLCHCEGYLCDCALWQWWR